MNTYLPHKKAVHLTIRPFGADKFQVYSDHQLLATFSEFTSAVLYAERSVRSLEKRGCPAYMDPPFSALKAAA